MSRNLSSLLQVAFFINAGFCRSSHSETGRQYPRLTLCSPQKSMYWRAPLLGFPTLANPGQASSPRQFSAGLFQTYTIVARFAWPHSLLSERECVLALARFSVEFPVYLASALAEKKPDCKAKLGNLERTPTIASALRLGPYWTRYPAL